MIERIFHFFSLNTKLFKKLFVTDFFFSFIIQFFIFGRSGYFDYLGNSIYFGIFFLAVLVVQMSIIKNFSAGASFYLMLPVKRGFVVAILLVIQVLPFICMALCETLLLRLIIPIENREEIFMNIMHCIFFFTMLKVATIPVLIYSSKHFIYVCFYFLSYVPVWVLTGIFDENIFIHCELEFRYIYKAVFFLFLFFCLNWYIIINAKK